VNEKGTSTVTSTSVADPAPAQATTVNALLLPADPAKQIRGLTVQGLDDVRRVVGGHVEGFASAADPSLWGYTRAGGILVGGAPNARATSLLKPDGAWISGDVILTACEDHQHDTCELPPKLAALIDDPPALPEPTFSARGNTAAFHAWELARDEHGARSMAVLTITLCPALEEPIGLADEYTAMLAARRERPGLFGGRICADGLTAAHCVLRERGIAIGRNNTSRFAGAALATVRALYAVGDERVTGYFTPPAGSDQAAGC
jgi:hypothetical protein